MAACRAVVLISEAIGPSGMASGGSTDRRASLISDLVGARVAR
jgi:hypothetical protein